MATQRQYLMQARVDFATVADQVAFTWLVSDIGTQVYCIENGVLSIVCQAGTGAGTLTPMSRASREQRKVGVPIESLRLVSSDDDVGNIAAIGGVGASDADPVFAGDAAGGFKWTWANGAHVGALGFSVSLADDFDGSRDVTLELELGSGTTDAFDCGVATTWDGGTAVADAASDTATKSATRHTVSVTIDKADVPDSAKSVTVRLTPPAHATNGFVLYRVAMKHYTK